jgi:hypothetical protein
MYVMSPHPYFFFKTQNILNVQVLTVLINYDIRMILRSFRDTRDVERWTWGWV